MMGEWPPRVRLNGRSLANARWKSAEMNRKERSVSTIARVCVALVALMAVFAVGGVGSAAASTTLPASGTFAYGPATVDSVSQDGGNVIMTVTCAVTYTGTLSGTGRVRGTLILHADGSANFHEVGTFTGTMNGMAGTLTFNIDGTGRGNPTVIQSHAVIVRGTGTLADLHGVINEVGTLSQGNPVGTYSGQILAAP